MALVKDGYEVLRIPNEIEHVALNSIDVMDDQYNASISYFKDYLTYIGTPGLDVLWDSFTLPKVYYYSQIIDDYWDTIANFEKIAHLSKTVRRAVQHLIGTVKFLENVEAFYDAGAIGIGKFGEAYKDMTPLFMAELSHALLDTCGQFHEGIFDPHTGVHEFYDLTLSNWTKIQIRKEKVKIEEQIHEELKQRPTYGHLTGFEIFHQIAVPLKDVDHPYPNLEILISYIASCTLSDQELKADDFESPELFLYSVGKRIDGYLESMPDHIGDAPDSIRTYIDDFVGYINKAIASETNKNQSLQ